MGTDRSFDAMLNEHLHYNLLDAEMLKRDWLLNKIEKDQSWKGGTLPVPFRGGRASTVKYGGLTAAADIGKSTYVRGEVTSQKEAWASIKFNHRDIIEHDGKVNEQSFLKLLPNELEDFLQYFKEAWSCDTLNGYICKFTADGNSSGEFTTDHPERLTIGQYVIVDDSGSSPAAGYVRTIDMNTGVVTLYDAVSGGSVVNLSGYSTTESAKVYRDAQQASGFTSLRDQFLSASNGGATNLFGVAKTAYPFLQTLQLDGSTLTEDNILEGVFNKNVTARNRCSGNPKDIVASYKNGAAILKNCQSTHGAYNVVPGSRKVSEYGWEEVMIGGPKGTLKLVMVQEMEDDVMYMMSDKGITLHSNGGFRPRVGPDGNKYFTVRETTGYYYVVDMLLAGELVVSQPSAHAVIYGIDFSLSES